MLKRLRQSVSAILAGQFVNVVGNLVLLPLFLSQWSTGMYGEWIALSAVVAYFGVTDLGMNSAAGNLMTAAYAQGDVERYRHLQGSAMAFYVGMALSVSVLLAVLAALFPLPAWIGIRHISPVIAAWVAWALAARLLWQMPAAQLGSIYRTTGDLAATQWLANLQSIGLLTVTATVLLLHGGILQLAIWSAAPMILVTTAAWFSLRRSHPELLPRLSAASLAGVRELLKPSLQFALIMLSMLLALQGPVVLVSTAFGGAAVALLVTTRTLANFMRQMVAPVQLALWPELTRLDAVGAEPALRLAHRLLLIGSVALSAAFAGALWFEGAGIMAVWTRGKLPVDVWLLRFFLIAVVLQSPWLASSVFTMASNQHRRAARAYAISAGITLTAIALLIYPCGLLAVPIGAVIGESLACYHFVIKDACVGLKEDYSELAVRLWSTVVAVCSAAWAAGYLGHLVVAGPILLRGLAVGVLTALAAGMAAWFCLRKDDRSQITGRCKQYWSCRRSAAPGCPLMPLARGRTSVNEH